MKLRWGTRETGAEVESVDQARRFCGNSGQVILATAKFEPSPRLGIPGYGSR